MALRGATPVSSFRLILLGLAFSGVLALALPAALAKKAALVEPRLEFVQTEAIEIDAESLGAVAVQIANPSRKPIAFSARLALPGGGNNPASALEVTPSAGRVRGLATRTLSIEVLPDQLEAIQAGSYQGVLIVTETRRNATLTRELVINVAQPLIIEQTITVYRGWPNPLGTSRIAFYRNQDVPLAFGTTSLQVELVQGSPLGVVVRDKGGKAAIESDGTLVNGHDVVLLRLAVDGELRAGTYKGTVDLAPSDGRSGTLAVTVIVTDLIFYPILALLFGIGAALAIQRWTGAGGRLNALSRRLAEIESRIHDRQEAYAEAMADVHAHWDVAEYLLGCAAELRARLRGMRNGAFTSVDAKDEKELVEVLDGLEREARRVGELAGELRKLDEAIEVVREKAAQAQPLPMPPDVPAPEEPKFIEWAISVMERPKPPGPCDLSKVAAYREQILKATALAEAWPLLIDDVKRSWSWAGALEQPVEEEEDWKLLREARRRLSEVEWELWNVTDADELDRKMTRGDLVDATQLLARLNYLLEAQGVGEGKTVGPLNVSLPGIAARAERDTAAHLLELLGEPDDPVKRIRWLSSRRRVFNALALYVLLAGAVYVGLQTLYFDKAFGTPRDYLNAFFWGLGSKAVVDIIASGLDAIRRAGVLAQPSR